MFYIPKNYVIRVGVGHAYHKLGAFDRALKSAGVCDYNLIKVSSIFPPECETQKDIFLAKGALLPSAFASIYSNILGEYISAAVAIAIPTNKSDIGVIMEHSSCAPKEETEKIVRNFAESAMYDRNIAIKNILSRSIQIKVETEEFYCAFATVSMW